MKTFQAVHSGHAGEVVPVPSPGAMTAASEAWQYEIRLAGHLDDHWSDWLGGLTVTRVGQGDTILRGLIQDQAALHGVLAKIRDLGLPLIALKRIVPAAPAGGSRREGYKP